MRNSIALRHIVPAWPFKTLFVCCTTALLLCSAFSFRTNAIVLDFSAITNTDINFNAGGTFNFTSAPGTSNQFQITTVTGGTGDSVGDVGNLAPGGPFTIGSISFPMAGEETANVSGISTLNIVDGHGHTLTGSLQWVNITTFGTAGIINLNGTINLTSLMYSGSSSDLSALAAAGMASDSVTFQFATAEALTNLVAVGGETSYSGVIQVTPEPGSLALAALGLAGVVALRLRRLL